MRNKTARKQRQSNLSPPQRYILILRSNGIQARITLGLTTIPMHGGMNTWTITNTTTTNRMVTYSTMTMGMSLMMPHIAKRNDTHFSLDNL